MSRGFPLMYVADVLLENYTVIENTWGKDGASSKLGPVQK